MKIKHAFMIIITMLLSVTVLNGCVKSSSTEDGATIISQSLSPDDKFKATVFIKQDTIDHADIYKVSVSNNQGEPPNEKLIYVGDCLESAEVFWQDNNNLLISINEKDIGSSTFSALSTVEDISITYKINTQSPRRKGFVYPTNTENAMIIWNEGRFQIFKSEDFKTFVMYDENGNITPLLENVTSFKWQNSKLYLKSNDGYATVDRHDECRLCIDISSEEIFDYVDEVILVESYEDFSDSDKLIFEQM